MSPDEVAADLTIRGSIEVEEFGALTAGCRVRKANQRWYSAFERGTGVVSRIFVNPNSAWEQKYRRADVELIVTNDDGSHSYLADYHVDLAWKQEKE